MLPRQLSRLAFWVAGAGILFGTPSAHTQPEVRQSNDSAITIARSYLESSQWLIVQALHLYCRDVTSGTSFKDAHEDSTGAVLTYAYSWSMEGCRGSDTVVFHANQVGNIDGILEVGPDTDPTKFVEFTNLLAKAKDKGVEYAVRDFKNSLKQKYPQEQIPEDTPAETVLFDILTLLIQRSTPVEGKAALEWALVTFSSNSRLPAYGLDGFRFGLGETEAFRNIGIQPAQIHEAILKVGSVSWQPSGLPPRDFTREADTITESAGICARIRPHDAFRAISHEGKGEEDLGRLDSRFAVCSAALHLVAPAGTSSGSRPLVFSIGPDGRGWRDAKGMVIEIRYSKRTSDPVFPEASGFERYGMVRIHVPQVETPCSNPPGGGTPPDRNWRQEGTQAIFRIRFDCEFAEIYDARSHLIVADLTLVRSSDPHKDIYSGTGPISSCPGNNGKVEMTRWSGSRIELKVEEPNAVDHICGGIKVGHVINAIAHTDALKVILIPSP
jgi:hypothetical protein